MNAGPGGLFPAGSRGVAPGRAAHDALGLPFGSVLVVDLDGTLVRGDTLFEGLARLASSQPMVFASLLPVLLSGKAAFKRRVSEAVELDPATLVYDPDVLALAQGAVRAGQPVYLVTAADQIIADAVARHLGVFDGAFGSDGVRNLKGAEKAGFLVDRFGDRGFVYAGDSEADFAVWRHAASGIVVGGDAWLQTAARGVCPDMVAIGAPLSRGDRWRILARALRLHQWAKNVLLFLPVFAAHRFGLHTLAQAATAFFAFSLCASSVYVLNDVLDLPHDRAHPTKRRRPFASGTLPLSHAPALIALTLGGGFALALLLPAKFLLMLLGYYACTLSYSFALKRRPVWDVMMLAGLYTVRVFAGSAATAIPISPWLLAFSMFLFFCLAVVKRKTELTRQILQGSTEKIAGRGYDPDDLDMLRSMAASSGYMAVLVLALYVNSADVLMLYPHPAALWLLCPVLLFWVSRVLMLSHRGLMNEDPVVFAFRDRVSLGAGAAAFIILFAGALG